MRSPASSAKIEELSRQRTTATTRRPPSAFRIIADHMRTSTFILGDDRGVTPLQRGSGLYPAPPDPPRGALWHEAGHARGLHLRNRQGHHRPVQGRLSRAGAQQRHFVLEQLEAGRGALPAHPEEGSRRSSRRSYGSMARRQAACAALESDKSEETVAARR